MTEQEMKRAVLNCQHLVLDLNTVVSLQSKTIGLMQNRIDRLETAVEAMYIVKSCTPVSMVDESEGRLP